MDALGRAGQLSHACSCADGVATARISGANDWRNNQNAPLGSQARREVRKNESAAEHRQAAGSGTAIGLDAGEYAFPYIAGYAGQKDGAAIITRLMDTIQKTAAQIIEVIETRLIGEH